MRRDVTKIYMDEHPESLEFGSFEFIIERNKWLMEKIESKEIAWAGMGPRGNEAERNIGSDEVQIG